MAQAVKTPVQILNEHCAKAGIPLPTFDYQQTQILPTTSFHADCNLQIGQTQYKSVGVGQRKKDAQHDAAKNMFLKLNIGMDYKEFEHLKKPAVANDAGEQGAAVGVRASESARQCATEDDEDSQYPQAGTGNPIAELEELCRVERLPDPDYDMNCEQVGPSHCPIMTVSCTVGKLMLKGRSKNKKMAKRIVAVKVLLELKNKKTKGSLQGIKMDDTTESVDRSDIVKLLSLEDRDSSPFTRSNHKTFEDFIGAKMSNRQNELAIKLSNQPGQYFEQLITFARENEAKNPLVGKPLEMYREWLTSQEKGIAGFYEELRNELGFEDDSLILKNGGKFMVCLGITLPELSNQQRFVSTGEQLEKVKEKAAVEFITYLGTMIAMK